MKHLVLATLVGGIPIVSSAQTVVAKPHRIEQTSSVSISMSGASARGALKRCSRSNGCEITITVLPYDPNTKECQGTIDTLLIFTSPKFFGYQTPRIVWKLDTSQATDADYAFDQAIGIDIRGATSTDFGNHGYDGGNNQRYYWDVVGDDSYAFNYDINLTRTPMGGTPMACPFIDPMIVNRD